MDIKTDRRKGYRYPHKEVSPHFTRASGCQLCRKRWMDIQGTADGAEKFSSKHTTTIFSIASSSTTHIRRASYLMSSTYYYFLHYISPQTPAPFSLFSLFCQTRSSPKNFVVWLIVRLRPQTTHFFSSLPLNYIKSFFFAFPNSLPD